MGGGGKRQDKVHKVQQRRKNSEWQSCADRVANVMCAGGLCPISNEPGLNSTGVSIVEDWVIETFPTRKSPTESCMSHTLLGTT